MSHEASHSEESPQFFPRVDEVRRLEGFQEVPVAEAPGDEGGVEAGVVGGLFIDFRVADVDGVFFGTAQAFQGFPDHVRRRLCGTSAFRPERSRRNP